MATITDAPQDTTPTGDDLILTVDTATNASKSVTLSDAAKAIVPNAPADSVDYTKWTNNVSFNATMSAGISVSASTFTKMPFNTVAVDRGGNYVTATYRFVAPVAGDYFFSASVSLPSATGAHRAILTLYKNGTEARRIQDAGISGSTARGVNGSGNLTLAAGDYVELFGFYDVAVTMGDSNVTTSWFSGNLVSPQ